MNFCFVTGLFNRKGHGPLGLDVGFIHCDPIPKLKPSSPPMRSSVLLFYVLDDTNQDVNDPCIGNKQ